jgi:putative transposase
MVEEMLAARGISVTYETIRQWGLKFGREFANRIRRRAPCRGDKWHLDEVAITIASTKHWLWRAVDQEGFVLDVLVQSRRDKKAAKRLLRKLLKKQGRAPRVLITDKLKSYAAAKREIMPGVKHRQHKGLNNRAENSHQPTRRRERIMSASSHRGRCNGFCPSMIILPTFSPAAPVKTPPSSFVSAATKHSPHGPRSRVWQWLRNHVCRWPSFNPSCLSQIHQQ